MTAPITITVRIISAIVYVIEVLLGMRFFLRIAGANANNAIVQFFYGSSDVFLAPFRSIFATATIEGAALEWSTLFAMACYGIAGYIVIHLILALANSSEQAAREEV